LQKNIEAEEVQPETAGERKHVTALFSDLSGYTSISERLDPEDVKEVTSRVFGEISKIVNKYDGFIEKFVGDAVMALFGVPTAHEDDPLRAIMAAREIHDQVEAISPEMEKRVGQSLSMHTGINTGLVVTGEVDMEKGTHGIAGDTINLASRLSSLAKRGEILVDPITYGRAEGHFDFEGREPTKVKGKAEPVSAYRVLSPKARPVTIHRISGLRADLIGRKVEMARLGIAVEKLRKGRGTIFSIGGDPGTGKSRLIEEFKAALDLEEIQWIEGHAYPYSQNTPYFPLIDLMNRTLQIEEGDPPEKVRKKVESGLEYLIGKKENIVPYVGSLYALSYPEIAEVSPELWKSRLRAAIQEILLALTRRGPTVICFEDLHWADPSSIELLHFLLSEFRYPALFLCVYRPPFSLFPSPQLSGMGETYQEIGLSYLSTSEAQDMVQSLLKTKTIPLDLRKFIQQKVEGNPFYLEEIVNSLIESETLTRDRGGWRLTGPIDESEVPSTVHGVISGRLDRLEKETKRVLQEASVIGRAFLYQILEKITGIKEHIDQCLTGLERLDLIRARALQPDLEYIFKHALTQEVVYSGLLKRERRVLHGKIALVMEQLFHDRLSEFYETLAFHFTKSESLRKAVLYLMKSGEKGLRRYALEESHQYYKEAYDILNNKPDKSKEEEALLLDLLISKWDFVFYYRGDFRGLTNLLSAHEDLAESFDDKAKVGMFYAWLGFAFYMNGRAGDSYPYLCKALELGEELENQQVIGYACTWLAWTFTDRGPLQEVTIFGERAQEISRFFESDHYLYFKPLGAIAFANFFSGDRKSASEVGAAILEYGQRHSNVRCLVVGHISTGLSHLIDDDVLLAIEFFKRAIEVSEDIFYSQWPRTFLGMSYLQNEQIKEAEEALREVLSYSQEFGVGVLEHLAYAYLGVVSIAKGQLSRGLEMIEEAINVSNQNGRISISALLEYTLGKAYLELVDRTEPISFSLMVKDIGFLMESSTSTSENAEQHFHKAIEIAKEIGAKGILGQAYLDLGLLYKTKEKKDRAQECLSEAINIFKQCETEVYLQRAKEALTSLERRH
jgi:class 3 adenylate cyclase/tetratricopeptide (TPR) repeat protein